MKPPYKPTGVMAVDMCAACINHYERQGGKVAKIFLRKGLWMDFNKYMRKLIPGHVDTGEIDFDDTLIVQASIIQNDSMHFELEGSNKKQSYNA
jgi:hypothetical protein